MVGDHDKTMLFRAIPEGKRQVREVLVEVFAALNEKGYNPVGQMVGYLISGDPTFITSHRNARNLIRQFERDVILEELIVTYLQDK